MLLGTLLLRDEYIVWTNQIIKVMLMRINIVGARFMMNIMKTSNKSSYLLCYLSYWPIS